MPLILETMYMSTTANIQNVCCHCAKLTAQNSPLFLGFNFNRLEDLDFGVATHPQIEETHGSTRCLPFIVLHSFPMLSLCLTGS